MNNEQLHTKKPLLTKRAFQVYLFPIFHTQIQVIQTKNSKRYDEKKGSLTTSTILLTLNLNLYEKNVLQIYGFITHVVINKAYKEEENL